ncbi:MAG TPA: polysaccharide biosynthesis C-terminal domain-containing protein [Solirubrobacteraceae bacterium]|nr:polysaccharide biosynthesis C-terminal domain-containing protein [Solirubrobacteraceae bacterium]
MTIRPEEEPLSRFRPPSIVRGGVEAVAARGLELVGQVAVVVVTARLMGPAGRGVYALASLTAILCALPFGSVWSANAIEVAKRRTSLPELLGASLVIALVGGVATALVAFAIAATLGDRWWVVGFPAATAPLILFARYAEGLYQAIGHVRAVNVITVARVLLPLVLVTPPLLADADTRTVIAIWTLWLVLLPVFIFPPLRHLVGGPRLPTERGLYRRLVVTGTKLSVANTALVVSPRIALIALAAFSGDAAVGVYSLAVAAGDVLYLTTNSLVSTTFEGIASRDREASAALAARSIRHTFLLAASVGALLVPSVALLLPIVVGDGFEDVPLVLLILVPGVLGLSCFWVLHTFFTVQLGRPLIVTRIAVITLTVNTVLCVILVPVLGLWGAAIATTTANLISATVSLGRFRAISGVPLRTLRPGAAELRDYAALGRAVWARVRS